MCAGQPSCVLYSNVINNIFLENVCRFVALIGGVEVKFKEVLDGVLKSVQVYRVSVFTVSRNANSNL